MPAPVVSPWPTLLPAALAGTRRQPFASLPGLTPALGTEANAPEKQLLLTAANLVLVQQAGQRPRPGPARVLPPQPREAWPAVPAALASQLEDLLAEAPNDPSDNWPMGPHINVLHAALLDLQQQRRRLPPRTVLALLRYPWGYRLQADTARQVLGEWGRALHELLGPDYSPWYGTTVGPAEATPATPEQQLQDLGHRMQQPLPAGQSYLPEFAALPAGQRTQLLWQAWAHTGGNYLPLNLQAELDELLAATAPTQRPWSTGAHQARTAASYPRLADHPVLARLGALAAPLLVLERPAGKPPRVRIELPATWSKAWQEAGLSQQSNNFYHSDEAAVWLQELLYALGPRYWATRWQLPPAEVVALVAAAKNGRLVLDAWMHSLVTTAEVLCPEPEFVRALLAAQPRAWLRRRMFLIRHLPLADQVTWLAAILPTSPVRVPEPAWAEDLNHRVLPLREPALVRVLLPALAVALAAPRTSATAEQSRELPRLLNQLAELADPRLLPEVQAALGAVVPVRPAHAEARDLLLRGLALRLALRQAGGAPAPPAA